MSKAIRLSLGQLIFRALIFRVPRRHEFTCRFITPMLFLLVFRVLTITLYLAVFFIFDWVPLLPSDYLATIISNIKIYSTFSIFLGLMLLLTIMPIYMWTGTLMPEQDLVLLFRPTMLEPCMVFVRLLIEHKPGFKWPIYTTVYTLSCVYMMVTYAPYRSNSSVCSVLYFIALVLIGGIAMGSLFVLIIISIFFRLDYYSNTLKDKLQWRIKELIRLS